MRKHPWMNRLPLALAATAAIAFVMACGGGDNEPDPTPFLDDPTAITGLTPVASFPVDIPRSDGKTLTLAAAPSRIVSLSPAATEILYAIGAGSSLAAVDNDANFPDAAAAFPTRFDALAPSAEAIAAANPDLVILAADTDGIVAKLDELNIPVFFQDIEEDITTLDAVFAQITLLGKVTGNTDAAATLLSDLGVRVQKVTAAVQGVSNATSPKVYHEVDPTLVTVSDGTFIGDLYRTLHARNIAGDGGGAARPQLTHEAIIASAPDVIIFVDEELGVTVEALSARPGWDALPAVTNRRIIAIDPDIVSRPGPRIVDALEQLGKAIYPTRFP